ncbi:hypothetical protein HZF02_23745 [Pseudomonas yamanorum]|nr:hypothetical protein HZF02_23745 [Pseudomonas yamanorum]
MAIYEDMRAQLQELVDLVKQDEQYAAAVATENPTTPQASALKSRG